MLHLLIKQQFITKLVVVFVLLKLTACEQERESETVNEIEKVFAEIDRSHNKLKELFVNALLRPKIDNKEKCVCVPYYLCYDGTVAHDGRYLLESRYETMNACPKEIEICCKQPIFKMSFSSTCGHRSNATNKEATPFDEDTTEFGESPWTVMILQNNAGYQCVGSLIHPQVVLTAAHCVNTTDNYTIRAGEWDVRNANEPLPHQTGYVQRVIKHPDFNMDNLFYDVALLVLEKPFELAENVKVTCLTESAPYPLEANYDKCVATGWGLDKATGRYKRIMKKIEFSLILRGQCERSFRATRLGRWFELHRTFICAYGQNKLDVCRGDGGGPLVCSIRGEPERYQQVGITSWGIGCVENTPSVFIRIAEIRSWIDAQFEVLQFSKDYVYSSEKFMY